MPKGVTERAAISEDGAWESYGPPIARSIKIKPAELRKLIVNGALRNRQPRLFASIVGMVPSPP